MGVETATIPDKFRADLNRAVAVLRDHGAKEIYVFGSTVERSDGVEPNDLDIAVSGLPPRPFLHAYGILLGELECPFDLVDLDSDGWLSRRLRERGHLERVA
jgi:uncharacterized protein